MFLVKPNVLRVIFQAISWLTVGNLPSFTSVVAIIERENRILCIHRADGLGLCLPGGIVKWHESCENALTREIREETGYDITISKLVGVYSRQGRDYRFSCVQIAYLGVIVGGIEASSSEGQVKWLNTSMLPNLAFDHQTVIMDYLNRFNPAYSKTIVENLCY